MDLRLSFCSVVRVVSLTQESEKGKKFINNMKKIHSDLLAMNVFWFLEDLELYDNPYGFLESFIFTVARLMTFIMAIIVHRAFYKLMKRLPGRAVNQIIYPYMVRYLFRDIYNGVHKCWSKTFLKILKEQFLVQT